MHEISIMTQLVNAILDRLKEYDFVRVEEVELSVGELSFLAEDQLRFAFEILSENTPLQGAALVIRESPSIVRCENCGYEGPLRVEDDPKYHIATPIFTCPRCDSPVEVIKGRECEVTNVRLLMEEPEGSDVQTEK